MFHETCFPNLQYVLFSSINNACNFLLGTLFSRMTKLQCRLITLEQMPCLRVEVKNFRIELSLNFSPYNIL